MPDKLIIFSRRLYGLGEHMLRSFMAHSCLTNAAALSFTSLLAIVPLAAIGLAILTAFPGFAGVGDAMTGFVLNNFTPDANTAIQQTFRTLVSNANHLTGFGVVFLIFTSGLLLFEVEAAFSEIWGENEKRPLTTRLMTFWTLMTLGPVLIGVAFSVSTSYFTGLLTGKGVAAQSASLLEQLLPVTLELIGFTLVYKLLPCSVVSLRHALLGGAIATLLFELLHVGFGVYIRNFAAYDAIYGALSALPVFLIWTYLSWAVILFGGVVTAELPGYANHNDHS